MSLLDVYLKDHGMSPDGVPPGMFPMETARYLNTTIKVRKGIKKFVDPKNAADIVDFLPAPGSYTLGMVNGNFVFGDIVPHLMPARGKVSHFACSTLSLSVANAEMLIAAKAKATEFQLWVSHYFVHCDKGPHAVAVKMLFDADIDLKCARTHAKIVLLHHGRNYFVMEGSANLRSNANAEQMIILNDRTAYEFRLQNLHDLENITIDREDIARKIAKAKADRDKKKTGEEEDFDTGEF